MEENREELLEQLMPKLTALSERLEDMGIDPERIIYNKECLWWI